MVYTDGVHLIADSLDELYGYATKIGLNPDWIDFMGRNIHPHFNICGHVKKRALADISVQKVSCREIVKLCISNFRLQEADDELHQLESHNKKKQNDLEMPTDSDFEKMIDNILKRTGIRRSVL